MSVRRMLPSWLYDHERQMVRTGPRAVAMTGLAAVARANVLRRRRWTGWKRRFPELRVHLGCGGKYVQGWINLDLNPVRRVDVWLDITGPLPFDDGEVSVVASFHVFEHLDPSETRQTLRECWRVLRPGGVLRIGVPSLELAIEAYLKDEWQRFECLRPMAASRGGKLNETLLYYGQHKQAFDAGYLTEVLTDAGFREVKLVEGWESAVVARKELEQMQDPELVPQSLFVEARK